MRVLLICVGMLFGTVANSVEPEEILTNPILETRARELSKELRCLVCRNENIDSSNAGIAKDLRVLVRERLSAGDSDAEVIDFIVDRYGEFVLLKPKVTGINLILWAMGPFLLLIGMLVWFTFMRRSRKGRTLGLNGEEERRLKKILNQRD